MTNSFLRVAAAGQPTTWLLQFGCCWPGNENVFLALDVVTFLAKSRGCWAEQKRRNFIDPFITADRKGAGRIYIRHSAVFLFFFLSLSFFHAGGLQHRGRLVFRVFLFIFLNFLPFGRVVVVVLMSGLTSRLFPLAGKCL